MIDTALQLRERLYLHEELNYDAGSTAQLLRELIANPQHGALCLIGIDGQIAGYLLLTVCYSLEFNGSFGLLDEFYVDERWRGQGLGTKALEFTEAMCRNRGMKALRLEVSHSNLRALDLYRRRGFAVETRHLMTKWL